MEPTEKLNTLANYRKTLKLLEAEIQTLLEQALLNCPELKTTYDEYNQELEKLRKKDSELTNEIIQEVLEREESVKGTGLHAIYSKGRVTWDTKALAGYAAACPEINQFKKTGRPTVSIREVKNEKTN